MGRRRKGRQRELFVAASETRALGNPFYRALNRLLDEHGFDEFAEEACREFYAEKRGRPGIPPGVYFRMLTVGYLEGIGAERGIAWRCADSISLLTRPKPGANLLTPGKPHFPTRRGTRSEDTQADYHHRIRGAHRLRCHVGRVRADRHRAA